MRVNTCRLVPDASPIETSRRPSSRPDLMCAFSARRTCRMLLDLGARRRAAPETDDAPRSTQCWSHSRTCLEPNRRSPTLMSSPTRTVSQGRTARRRGFRLSCAH
eukprot:scaffold576_cov260-Pinguiococcus_pyrenoidosus.AAC.110